MVVATDRKHEPQQSLNAPLKLIMQKTIPIIERSLTQLGTVPIREVNEQVNLSKEYLQRMKKEFTSHTSVTKKRTKEGSKTTITTNLRDIMKPQQKDLLATSSQLFHLNVLNGIVKEPTFKKHKRPRSVIRQPNESIRHLRGQIKSQAQNPRKRSTQMQYRKRINLLNYNSTKTD